MVRDCSGCVIKKKKLRAKPQFGHLYIIVMYDETGQTITKPQMHCTMLFNSINLIYTTSILKLSRNI
jgi:hypothetical protein